MTDGWVVLTRPGGAPALFRITAAEDDAEARYAISGKATRLTLDTTEPLDDFVASYRRVSAYGGSIELAFADTPLSDWVAGDAIELAARADALPPGRTLILTGRRARLEVLAQSVSIEAEDGALRGIAKGGRLTLRSQPTRIRTTPASSSGTSRTPTGSSASLEAPEADFLPIDAEEGTDTIVEVASPRQRAGHRRRAFDPGSRGGAPERLRPPHPRHPRQRRPPPPMARA